MPSLIRTFEEDNSVFFAVDAAINYQVIAGGKEITPREFYWLLGEFLKDLTLTISGNIILKTIG